MSQSRLGRCAIVGPMRPYRGGIAQFLEAMAAGLEERGCRVTPVTFTRQYPRILFPGKSQLDPSADPVGPRPVRLIDSLNPLTWLRAARVIAAERPDVVLFKYWIPFLAPAFGTIARWLRRRGIPSIVVVDNAIPHERRPGDFVLGRYFLSAAKGHVVMSDAVDRDLDRLGLTVPRRRVGHPVYDLFGPERPSLEARETLGLPPHAPVVLFFGYVRRYKGLHVLIDAVERVARDLPDVRLVVAGEFYEPEEPYREHIRAAGIEDRVLLVSDFVPSDHVSTYFSAADLVAQPYLSATQSGVAQIAFHFEKPVLVTDVGGLAETLGGGEAGLIVPAGDPAAVAEGITRFFREGLADRLSDGVRRRKKYYSWDRLLDAIEDLADPAQPV